MKNLFLTLILSFLFCPFLQAQNLDPNDVKITLEQALPIALEKAKADFPDLDKYILYSISPRILKGDEKGLFWQFRWQEKKSPHFLLLEVRVYFKDSSCFSRRIEKGTYQKENDSYLK